MRGLYSLPVFAVIAFGAQGVEHQVQVLHGSPGSPFAQVVEDGGQQHLAVRGVGVQGQAQIIGPVERLGVEPLGCALGLQRHHLHVAGALVVLLQTRLQLLRADPAGQQAQVQVDAEDDALAIGAIGGHEHGTGR